MSSFLVVMIVAPEGVLHTRVVLEPGRCYGPGDVRVERGACPRVPGARTLTVNAGHLPSEDEFRKLAARAATRSADGSPGEFGWWLNLLIPF